MCNIDVLLFIVNEYDNCACCFWYSLMVLFELNVCIRQYVGLYSLKSTKGVKKN